MVLLTYSSGKRIAAALLSKMLKVMVLMQGLVYLLMFLN